MRHLPKKTRKHTNTGRGAPCASGPVQDKSPRPQLAAAPRCHDGGAGVSRENRCAPTVHTSKETPPWTLRVHGTNGAWTRTSERETAHLGSRAGPSDRRLADA